MLTSKLLRAVWIAAFVAAAVPQLASAQQVWTALSSEKIRPNAAARADRSAHISAAKNEFEALQVVVTGPATGVRATATSLDGPGTIDGVRLFREGLINVKYVSALDGATGWWPDALVPDVDEVAGERRNAFPFDVPAGESRAIWVEVHVPADARAGDYTGAVEVTWSGGSANVPVSLTVWPFRLPSTASLASAFQLTYGGLPSAHGVSGDAFAALRARYGALALDHRISLSSHDDGQWSDLAHFETFYGGLMDGTAPTQLSSAAQTSVAYQGRTDRTALQSWAGFYRSRGWLDRLFHYTCDEPPLTCAWSSIPTAAAAVHAADPDLRTLVTTDIDQATAQGALSSIDIMVPVVNYMEDRPGTKHAGGQRTKYDAFLAGSPKRALWMYQSCMSHGCGGTVDIGSPSASDASYTGWPTYMIDASAVRNRAMQWLAFRFDVSGELYYETVQAFSGGDAWTDQWRFSGNGDGTLFYPGTPAKIGGTTHVPVASIRLKMIREGMEDYEYLKLLTEAGDGALAREIANGLFPRAYETEKPASAVMAARARIAARLVALQSPGAALPPPGTTPPPGTQPPPEQPSPEQPSPLPGCTPGDAACLEDGSGGGGCGTGKAAEGALGAVVGLVLSAALFRRRRQA